MQTAPASPWVIRLHRPRVRGNRMFVGSLVLCTAMLLGQALIDSAWENLSCTILAAVSTIATMTYCFRRNLLQRMPMSVLAVLGFNFTTHSLALFAQTLTGRALTFNLQSPTVTFGYIVASQAVILAVHIAYANMRSLHAPGDAIARNILRPLSVFRMQTRGELWLLGSLGLGATAVSRVVYSGAIDYGDVGGKFLQTLGPLIVLPFFMPFRGMFLARPARSTMISMIMLVGFSALVVLLAVAMNRRVDFAISAYTVILASLMMIWMKRWTITSRMKLTLVALSLFSLPVISVAQDLATAMTISRGERDNVGTGELVALTMQIFNDKPALERARANAQEELSSGGFIGYSEAYISSEFLQRLTFTKYTDLTMTASQGFADSQRERIRAEFWQSLILILPTPVIRLIGSDLDKTYTSYSAGDLYENLSSGNALNSQRTGSSVTHFRDVFGSLWMVALAIVAIVVFNIVDSLTLRTGGAVIMSPVAFMWLFQVSTHALIGDSVRQVIDGVSRIYLLTVFDFVVFAMVARVGLGMIGGIKNERARMATNAAHHI